MSFVAALLPVVLYIFAVYQIDKFALVSVKRLVLLVVSGMAAALACFGLFLLTGPLLSEEQSAFLDPLVEEAIKALPLLILACRKKMVFFIDSVICGAAVGGGFSILENIFYLLGNQMSMGTVLFRGLEVALIHMGCSALVAAGLMFAVRLAERARGRLHVKAGDVLMAIFLLLAAPAIHIFHNAFHFPPLIQYLVVFGSMGGLLLWTHQYDSDMIHRWLDKGLDKQVSLLQSIQEGHLGETKTGQFLISVRDSFPAEVFFDIICYVQLYVELSVASKSRVMMREAGLDEPLEEEQKALLLSQYEEFTQLEKRLGRSARITIAPVVKYYPADRKSLEDLLAECRTRRR